MTKKPKGTAGAGGNASLPRAAAPTILTVGSALIAGLDYLGRAEFLLAFRNSNVANLLQFAAGYAWIAVFLGGTWWIFAARHAKESSALSALLVTAVIFFLLGVIVSSNFANQPMLIGGYGRHFDLARENGELRIAAARCKADFSTDRLRDKMARYDVVLVCGPADPQTDIMRDARVHISSPRSITRGMMSITSPMTEKQKEQHVNYATEWFQLAIIPKNIDVDAYKTLEQIQHVGGSLVGARTSLSQVMNFK